MHTSGALLHRERMVQQYHWLSLIFVGLGLAASAVSVGAAALHGAPLFLALPPLLFAAIFAALWALFSVLRVHVSTREVLIQLGPLGPRFALENIESARVVPRPSGRYSAGKIRINLDGTREHSYMMSTRSSELVEIVARDAKGRVHKVLLSSPDPARLVQVIENARAQQVSTPGVRVEAASSSTTPGVAEQVSGGPGIEPEREGAKRG